MTTKNASLVIAASIRIKLKEAIQTYRELAEKELDACERNETPKVWPDTEKAYARVTRLKDAFRSAVATC